MNLTLDQFIEQSEHLSSRDERYKLFQTLPYADQLAYRLQRVIDLANDVTWPEPRVLGTSPSGEYTVSVQSPNAIQWLSKCTVMNTNGSVVAEFLRNYDSVWYVFVESHPANGHDYLISGEDYQGHTVIDLTTGEKKTHIPAAAYLGYGWCPVSASLIEDTMELQVEGCFWACPYQTHYWDFSDPGSITAQDGVPNLTEKAWLGPVDDLKVTVERGADGTLTHKEHIRIYRETGLTESEVESVLTALLRPWLCDRGDSEESRKAHAEYERQHDIYFPEDEEGNEVWDGWDLEEYITKVYAPLEDGSYSDEQCTVIRSERAQADHDLREEADRILKETRRRLLSEDALYTTYCSWESDTKPYVFYPSVAQREAGESNPFFIALHMDSYRVEWGVSSGPIEVKASRNVEGSNQIAGTYERSVESLRRVVTLVTSQSSTEKV